MSTAVAALAPLRLPVFAAPMFLISGPELVVAACRAGIVGAFPTPNARPIEVLDDWMQRIASGLAQAEAELGPGRVAPWCANLVTHRSNERLPQDLERIARFKPPVVVTALGGPRPAVDVVHGYGGIVIADVVNLTLARKAIDAGADGLACICHGAGGHTGTLNPFAFVGAVREFFSGPVVVGGGIATGAGVAGALAAGADYVYMGTRFIATTEAIAAPAYKQMLVDGNADDLLVSAALTGTPASWLKPSLRANGLDPDDLPTAAPKRDYNSNTAIAAKKWMDVWAAGQGLGAIHAVEPVASVVDRLESEFLAAQARMARWRSTAAAVT